MIGRFNDDVHHGWEVSATIYVVAERLHQPVPKNDARGYG